MSRKRPPQTTYSHGRSADTASGPVVSRRGESLDAPALGLTEADDERRGVALELYLKGLRSHHSQRAAKQALSRALRLLGEAESELADVAWWNLRQAHMTLLRRRLLDDEYSVATANLTMSVMRGVAKQAYTQAQLDVSDYRGIAEVKGIANDVRIPGRVLTVEELKQLFQSCRDDSERANPTGPRDAAMLGMMCAGMRRDEVANLTLADVVSAPKGEISVQHRAGHRAPGRTVWLPEGAAVGLCEWLEIRGNSAGPLWSRIRKGGHLVLPPTGISGQSVFKMCQRRGKRAGIARTLNPVDLRRTFMAKLLEAGADVTTVQALVGHASPATTSRYAPKGNHDGADVAQLFDVDY